MNWSRSHMLHLLSKKWQVPVESVLKDIGVERM